MTPETPKSSMDIMAERIQSCIKNPKVWGLFSKDFLDTFSKLGFSDHEAQESLELISRFFSRVKDGQDLPHTEKRIRTLLNGSNVRGVDFADVIEQELSGRADIIYGQIEGPLKSLIGEDPAEWPFFDWGCGDAEVSRRIYDKLGLPVSTCDVRDYRSEEAKETGMPFFEVRNNQLYSDGKILNPGDRLFRIGLMTNVAHHEADNEKLLESLSKHVSDYLVVIETVPDPHSEEDEQVERDRTFMNDYLYNRLFHDADVPVPGTYETREGWVERFKKHGWELVGEIEDLGYDQPTIQDYHVLYVFKRNDDLGLALKGTRNHITGELNR
jgi:hypothetical protein